MERINNKITVNESDLVNYITNNLNMSEISAKKITKSNPALLTLSFDDFKSNVEFFKSNKISTNTIKTVFSTAPLFFHSKNITKNFLMVSKLLTLSPIEKDSFLIDNFNIFLFPSSLLNNTAHYITREFMLSDHELSALVRSYPTILTFRKEDIYNITRTLMHTFSLSEAQVIEMIFKCPQILNLNSEKILERFNTLCNTLYFVKRDTKEMILSYPEILFKPLNFMGENILNLARIFGLENEREISDFIRNAPVVMIMANLKDKLNRLKLRNISPTYIKNAPSVLLKDISEIIIKNAIILPFNLYYNLDQALNLDFDLILSRLKYSSLNGGNFKDSLISPELFKLKYGLSSKEMITTHKANTTEVEKIFNASKKYTNNYNSIGFIKSDFVKEIKYTLSVLNEENISTTDKLKLAFVKLGLDLETTNQLVKLFPSYVSITSILATIEVLSKKLNRLQIIDLLHRKPTILCSNPNILLDEINNLSYKNLTSFEISKAI